MRGTKHRLLRIMGGIVFVLLAIAVSAWWALPRVVGWASRPLAWSPKPVAGLPTRCFREAAWAVCVHEPPDADPNHLLIHFHGRRGNETWWNDAEAYSGALYGVWRAQGLEPPIVASVSFGPLWLLVNEASEGPTLSQFEREVLQRIEASLRQPVVRRSVVGESMGGVNALMVGVRSERFQKAAALCPPLYEASPTTSPLEIPSLARQLGLSASQALLITGLARRLYPDESVWRASDPLQALKAPPRTAFYVTCGATDPWRCMPGATRFSDAVERLGGSVEWVPRSGGHCDVDVESLARFLVPREDDGTAPRREDR